MLPRTTVDKQDIQVNFYEYFTTLNVFFVHFAKIFHVERYIVLPG